MLVANDCSPQYGLDGCEEPGRVLDEASEDEFKTALLKL